METVSDFIFLGSKITADGDCSHEIKRYLLLGRPTPVFLPGESQGRESLVGCRLWGHTESDTTEATQQQQQQQLLRRKAMANLDSILKRRDITLPTNVHIVKAMVFPVVLCWYESWAVKKAEHQIIDALELWCWRRLFRVSWTARRSNQSILKGISPEYSLKDWC